MKTKFIITSLFALLATFGFSNTPNNSMEGNVQSGEQIYFPALTLMSLAQTTGCDGIRFYKVISSDGGSSSLACATAQGMDFPLIDEAEMYQMFIEIHQGGANMNALNTESARAAVEAVGRETRFAVTIPIQEINALLSVPETTGLMLVQITDSKGNNNYTISSAVLSGNDLNATSVPASFTSDSPCPASCGATPNAYLINMME